MRKIFSIICLLAIVFTLCVPAVKADSEPGSEIFINLSTEDKFSDVMFVSEGKVYVPVRLMFPRTNDEVNKMGLSIMWNDSVNAIRLLYGPTTGEGLVNGAPPFVGMRTSVELLLMGDLHTGATAYITYAKYDDEDYANGEFSFIDELMQLDDPVYIRDFNGGSRIFVSTDDVEKITGLLGLEDTYSVRVYPQ